MFIQEYCRAGTNWDQPCSVLSVQFSCSAVSDSSRPRGLQGLPVLTNSRSFLKLMSFESVMPPKHLILCRLLLLLPSIFPSMTVLSNELALHIRWPKYWSFSFSISSPNEYSGLNFFRIDWFDLFSVQRTLKNLLQHHSLIVSIL